MLKKTLREIADFLGGELCGDGDQLITGVAGIDDAVSGQISYVASEKYLARAEETCASALIVGSGVSMEGMNLIRVKDPEAAWERLVELAKPKPIHFEPGVDPCAWVSEEASLGKDVVIMAHATVEAGAIIGDSTIVYPGVYVGHFCSIGKDCRIYPNVVLRERVVLEDRVIIQPGAVIGSDGFGYAEVDGRRVKQEQSGTVILEEDVEVGANVAIDRARFDVTRICRGTKIDNLVQIAHNVVIGENSIIISQAGIAGSTRIGKNVILAGQVGVAGHIKIGNNVKVAAKGGVTKSVEDNEVLYGNPAGRHADKKREVVHVRRLPKLMKKLKALSERVRCLEAQSENDKKSH